MISYQILYVSKPTKQIDSNSIRDIVTHATEYNTKNDITGILLFRSGVFLQLLEGEKSKVEALYVKIEKDPRHTNVVRILSIEENERIFPIWGMAYHEISDLDIKMVSEFMSWNKLIAGATDIDNKLILQMLNRFKSVGTKS